MLNDQEKKRLTARLSRVEGQVRGLARMLDEDHYCIDVLHQVAAVQGALAEFSKKMLTQHLDTCVRSAMTSGDEARRDEVLRELKDVFARYGRVDVTRRKK